MIYGVYFVINIANGDHALIAEVTKTVIFEIKDSCPCSVVIGEI